MDEDMNHTVQYWVDWVIRRNDRRPTPCVIEVGARRNGVYITLPNGIKVSIQWGTGNYCDRRDYRINWWDEDLHDPKGSRTAEVAMWNKDEKWYQLSDHDSVIGYRTVAHVHGLLDRALSSEDFAPLWGDRYSTDEDEDIWDEDEDINDMINNEKIRKLKEEFAPWGSSNF